MLLDTNLTDSNLTFSFQTFTYEEPSSVISDADSIERKTEIVRDKLSRLESLQARMRVVNSLVRNRNTKKLKELGYSDAHIEHLLEPVHGKVVAVFPDYKIRNSFEKIRSLKTELKVLEAHIERADMVVHGATYTYAEEAATGKILFRFQSKQAKPIRLELRKLGFLTCSSNFTYSRSFCVAGISAAKRMREYLDTLV